MKADRNERKGNTRVMVLLSAIVLLSITCAAETKLKDKDQYKPYSHEYPQVIQAHDYETIGFIERLHAALESLGNGAVKYEADDDSVTFRKVNDQSEKFTVRLSREGNVAMEGRHYDHRNTRVLVKTLIRLLGGEIGHNTVRFGQFRTRGYIRRTVVEFDGGASVVVVESFSNGPGDEERLYILDLVEPEDSFFLKP